jgi:photosystem II stability/assembly factor-like uncharacterized protein
MRLHVQTILRWLVLPGLLLLTSAMPASAARGAEGPDWELLGLGEAALQLYTPTSGAFFARTASGLARSDDGGATWRSVDLPPRGRFQSRTVVAVDPADHTILFAAGEQGVYRSTDDGTTWTPLALPADTGTSVRAIAISPADRSLVYVSRASDDNTATTLWLLRSGDGGDTWEVARRNTAGPGCGFGVLVFQPHASEAGKLFYRAGCYRGEPNGDPLSLSTDRGGSSSSITSILEGNAVRIVGGQGANPGRYYLASNKTAGQSGQVFRMESLFGTDWLGVLAVEGASMAGLAYDPAAPDHVYAGTTQGAIMASTNAGRSWSPIGRQDLGTLYDLALGVDGQNLYAATDQGVWRMSLSGP